MTYAEFKCDLRNETQFLYSDTSLLFWRTVFRMVGKYLISDAATDFTANIYEIPFKING